MKSRVCSLIKKRPPQLNVGFLSADGGTVPVDGSTGYQASCYFQDTTNGVIYVNEGTVANSDFNALGDLTSVDYSAGNGTAITISGTYTTEGIFISRASTRGMRVGAFASAGAVTSAMILDSTTPTAVEIHGGVATDQGSGANLRPLRSRFIVNLGSDARIESETYGIQGQLVVKESNLGHWHAGVLGTVECQTTMVVSNVLAGVAAVTGRIGGATITVNTGCFLSALSALSISTGVTQTGTAVYAGLYVTKTSGAVDFGYGAYIENSDVGVYVVGATVNQAFVAGVQDTGVETTTTYPFAVEIHNEANADVVAGATGSSAGIYNRYAIEAAQTSQTNHISVFAKLRVKADLADGNHVGVYGLVEQSAGQITGTSSTLTAAGFFALDISPTDITTGHLNGVCIDSSVATGGTMSATMAAIRIKTSAGKLAWTTGITLEAAACTNGIDLSVTTQACTMTVTALPANARGARYAFTCATPAMTDGYGTVEIDLTVTGTATGKVAAASTWINLGGSATVSDYNHVHTDGIWDGGATLTGAYISWAKYQCLLASNPAWCSLWELNFDGANSEVDSLFNVNSLILALGYTAGTPSQSAVGSIPFCSEAGGQLRYIYLYDSPS